MAKAKRVFEIAQELSVASKAIVDKCTAEGIPGITNHMSPVKLGLEQTIREWFSDAHKTATSVETTEKVDMTKARKARRRKAGAKDSDAPDAGGDATAAAIAEPETATPAPIDPPPADAASASSDDVAAHRSVRVRRAAPGASGATERITPEAAAPVTTPRADSASAATSEAPAAAQPSTATAPIDPAPTTTVTTQPPVSTAVAPAPTSPTTTPPSVVPPPPTTPTPTPTGRATTTRHPAPSSAAPATPATPATPAPPPAAAPPPIARLAEPIRPAGKPNVPDRPTIVKPLGTPMQRPTSAVLRGPKVVRIERADPVAAPRPRRPMGGGGGPSSGGAGGAGPNDAGISRSRGPARGRGAGAPPTDQEAPGKQPAKRRSLSTRRGRSAEALPIGPTKFTEADLAELDAKLHHATGYLKQRRRELKKGPATGATAQSAAVTGGRVEIVEPITIKSLSSATGLKATDIIKYLFKKGVMANINSAIGSEMAQEVAMEHNIELAVQEQQTAEQLTVAEFEQREAIDVRPRPPVATVLGHVDHGKTSLLDRIRKADVAAHEAGGITQHVGAYRVTIKGHDGADKTVVFLDTPGHEAFTSMRSRGAKMTDLVVLVVAADDGVMPQTVESINHAKAAGVPIIVALNKIDKPEATEANIRKIFGQLAEQGLNPTEWGGTTEVMKVSATQGTGITELLEVLDYQAQLLDLKADYGGTARGTVIESEMQPGRGPVARVLVQQGRVKVGDFVVIGRAYGRVRDMTDEHGKAIVEAGPATPLELSGIDMIPDAGDKFYVTDTLGRAEEMSRQFREAERQKQLASQTKVTLDNFADQLKAGTTKELRIVLKADVQGSIDVLKKSLGDLGNQEVSVKILHAAVGGITESDVLLADASDAIIVGFHVIAPPMVKEIAEARGIDVRVYRIIYEAVEEITKALEGLLEPEKKEEELASADVREVFRISKVGSVAGCLVTSGTFQRGGKVRVVRDNTVVTENRNVDSLRRIKEDVKEVRAGTECGIRILGFDDLKPGDKLICYSVTTIARKLK